MKIRIPVLLVGTALVVSACGSTVGLNVSGRVSDGAALGTPDGSAAPAAGGQAQGVDPVSAATALGGSYTPQSAAQHEGENSTFTPSGSTASSGASSPAVSGLGPGVSAKTINIGVVIVDDAGAANAAIGAGAVTHGDDQAEYRIMVKEINGRGGLGGRQISLLEYHVSATSTETTEQLEQRACAFFTQDHKVAMVINISLTDNGIRCLTSKGVVLTGGTLSYSTDQTYTNFPHFLEPDSMSLTRVVKNYADGMEAMGFWGKSPKVGFMTYDFPALNRATEQLKAALAVHGRKLDEVSKLTYPQSSGDEGAVAADISSTVLRFRSAGVTHVMFLDPSAVSELLFMNAAESQGYRPRYGFGQGGAAALRSTGVAKAQFTGALTVSWMPRLDGVPAAEQRWPSAEKTCLDRYAKNGLSFDSDNARRHAADICDIMELLWSAARPLTGVVNADTLAKALRTAPVRNGAGSYRFSLSGGRSDGVDLVRYNAYAADCDCFHYMGGLHTAS